VARTASDTLPTSQGNGAGASPLEFRPRTVIVASILAAAVIATAGSLSVISLGDETSHIRQTRAYAESGSRVPYDPLFSSIDNKDPRPFGAAPLWHAGLAILWRLIGSPSQMVAQIYQAGFYLLLLLSVYFGVRQIWNDSAASWAWLLIATMPMACAYSMLLYQDVPGIAVSALGLFLLFRRNFLWAGICLAGAYLVKMNMLSYAPWAVVFAAWWARGTWKRRLTAAVLVAVPLASALGYDIIWRMAIYGSIMGMCVGDLSGLSANAMEALGARPANFAAWNPDTIYTPRSLLSHLGIPVVLGVGAAVVRAWDCVSKWMWVGVGLAAAGFVVVFVLPGGPQVRYAFPVFLALVMLGGKGLSHSRLSRWLYVMIIAGCVAQAGAAFVYVFHQRQICEWEKAAYAWVRENTPENARIMCPEQVLASETGRPFFWSGANPSFFMTEMADKQRQELLTYYRVSHIVVPLRRVYEREAEGDHSGGYARDFVEKAHTLPYLKKAYENPGYVIFGFNPRTGSAADGPVPGRGGPS
jgi:hypothetical protein